jgi:2-polyprenyl-3-methyl-5-hydroxy-6-metoxy-1,4-benzoquinol methylase
MKQHWDKVYGTKEPNQVSWFVPHLRVSLALIDRATRGELLSSIIDVGGGASTLVDDLIKCGYQNVTVLDICQAAFDIAQKRLGDAARLVQWIQSDVVQSSFPQRSFDVWHDRAVFHFLTTPEERRAYVRNVASAIKLGGHAIVATFGPEGPMKCSGLDVMRYDADSLHREFGKRFRLVESIMELHNTPFGTTQQFLYCNFKLEE